MRFLLLCVFAVAGYMGFGSLELLERNLLYPRDPTPVTSADFGLSDFDTLQFVTADGETLTLWHHRAEADEITLIYFHGNAGTLGNRAARFQSLASEGYGVLAPAYRGYSGSTGLPSEDALRKDMLELWQQLETFGATPAKSAIYGESLGAAVAIALVADATEPPVAMVLEAPFTSIPDLVRLHYPALRPAIPLLDNRWPSKTLIRQFNVPLLILHGENDPLIPAQMGRTLFANATGEQNAIYVLPDAGHNDLWQRGAKDLIFAFLTRINP